MSMLKAEVSSSSQTAHYNHRLRESLTSRPQRSGTWLL